MSANPSKSREWPGLLLLAAAVVFLAIVLGPEARIERAPVNDAVFHIAAGERLLGAIRSHEPFLDPWVAEWALGYPVWQSYQPVPHLILAGLFAATESFATHQAAFAWFLLLCHLLGPILLYVSARALGLRPIGAGLASLLLFAPSEAGIMGSYGLGFGATVWRGSGLFTQLVSLLFLMPALAVTRRAVDRGRGMVWSALLIALTFLSHIIFGYVAFASAGVIAWFGPKGRRMERLRRFAVIVVLAIVLIAWFVVPLALHMSEINHSRWEPTFKWNSFGARKILDTFSIGGLFDSGRLPWLTALVIIGLIVAIRKRRDPTARRLLALVAFWLALFFGRITWGRLVRLVFIPADFQMQRLQAAFELFAIVMAAWAIGEIIASSTRRVRMVTILFVTIAVAAIGMDRAHYLAQNTKWGDENLAALAAARYDLDATIADVRAILAETPGRASAGLAARWGGRFKVGSTTVYSVLARHHIDEASFLYHSMSLPSDVMVLRNERDAAEERAFGIRAIVAPTSWVGPPTMHRRAVHGRFAVWEASPEGYFGLVDVLGHFDGPRSAEYDVNASWLRSQWARDGNVVAYDSAGSKTAKILPGDALLHNSFGTSRPRGRIVSSSARGGDYRAVVDALRPTWVTCRITWDPDLVATVDGHRARLVRVSPGFGAVAVGMGRHTIEVRYLPGAMKLVLFILGCLVFIGIAVLREICYEFRGRTKITP